MWYGSEWHLDHEHLHTAASHSIESEIAPKICFSLESRGSPAFAVCKHKIRVLGVSHGEISPAVSATTNENKNPSPRTLLLDQAGIIGCTAHPFCEFHSTFVRLTATAPLVTRGSDRKDAGPIYTAD